jgi:predicted DCC family thiol-disulfide oxidoreductase YuxK
MPLLYDGDCGFCTRAVAWIARRFDPQAPSAAWQDADLEALGVTPAEAKEAVQWAEGDERAAGADAIAAWLRGARRLRPFVRLIPLGLPLGRLLYPVVARNRGRISRLLR